LEGRVYPFFLKSPIFVFIVRKGEEERVDVQEQQRQWEQFQRDLLLAVRVAENFQAESQIEVKQLQQQLHALNKVSFFSLFSHLPISA
jgi:hypothetical protein